MRESLQRVLVGAFLLLLMSPMVAAADWQQGDLDRGYVTFRHTTLQLLLPDYAPPPEAVSPTVSCALAQGEFQSVQIGIHALTDDLRDVQLELETDLSPRVYRPVDEATKAVLQSYEKPFPDWLLPACLDESSTIASIPKGTSSFFWITLQAPQDAAPRLHRGKVRIQPAGRPATELALDVTVRSFRLPPARVAYAPFFDETWGAGAYLPKFVQADDRVLGPIFRDMAEHSHNSIIGLGYRDAAAGIDFSQIPPPANWTFDFLLPLGVREGLFSRDIPIFHFNNNVGRLATGNLPPLGEDPESVQQKNDGMAWYERQRQQRNWPELISYGRDEPSYPNPELHRREARFRQVHMRLGTAMFSPAVYGLGDVHDVWIVIGGDVTPELCAEAQRQGAEVWTYICSPMAHRPLDERHYAGLYIWAYGLKGHTTWHYYAQPEFRLVWFREGDLRPKPVVGWETRREGIDDYRYLQMLEDSVAAHRNNPVAAEAKQWLADLRARVIAIDPHVTNRAGGFLGLEEYERIRAQASGYIERLGAVPEDRLPVYRPSVRKDEAKPFRGRSVEKCLAGLRDRRATVRRAAAWALFEKGPAAAPAVGALARLLQDPEVRLPALRALEAIGPAARPALPQISLLRDHPDGFVRLGASIAANVIESQ